MSSCSSSSPLRPDGRGAKEEEALELGEGSREELLLSRQRAESSELVELWRHCDWGTDEGEEEETVDEVGRTVGLWLLIQGWVKDFEAVRRSLEIKIKIIY